MKDEKLRMDPGIALALVGFGLGFVAFAVLFGTPLLTEPSKDADVFVPLFTLAAIGFFIGAGVCLNIEVAYFASRFVRINGRELAYADMDWVEGGEVVQTRQLAHNRTSRALRQTVTIKWRETDAPEQFVLKDYKPGADAVARKIRARMVGSMGGSA